MKEYNIEIGERDIGEIYYTIHDRDHILWMIESTNKFRKRIYNARDQVRDIVALGEGN